jgi:hypothetical protein
MERGGRQMTVELTQNMIHAAMRAGTESGALIVGAKREDVGKMLQAVLAVMPGRDLGPRYPLWVKTGLGTKKARFGSVTERYAYFRVEMEDGKEMVIHANDILPNRGPSK